MIDYKDGKPVVKNNPQPQLDNNNNTQNISDVFNNNQNMNTNSGVGFRYNNYGGKTRNIDLTRIRSGIGQEHLIKAKKKIEEMINSLEETKRIKVTLFDKTVFGFLTYSSLVFHAMSESNGVKSIFYYIVLFKSTGRRDKTVSEVMSTITSNPTDNNKYNELWTIDEAINDNYHKFIVNELYKGYGIDYERESKLQNGIKPVLLEGVIIHEEESDTDMLAQRIFCLAGTVFVTQLDLSERIDLKDLNIKEAMKTASNRFLNIDTFYSDKNTEGPFGDLYRTDFTAKLIYRQNSKTFTPQQLNSFTESDETICTIGGFVTAIPIEYVDQITRTMVLRYRPHIIITRVDLDFPTVNYLMTAILTSLVMVEKPQFLSSLYYGPITDPGILNLVSKIDGEKGATKVRDPKLSREAAMEFLFDMLSFEPVITIDIPHYNDSSNYLSIMAGCAGGFRYAGEEFISHVSEITGGAFNENFDPTDVFQNSGVTIPLGYWNSKNGKRDLRDIDYAFILANTQDINLANRWVRSDIPGGCPDIGEYFAKVDVISKIVPDAVITGKATRLSFTSKFINHFKEALRAIGFTAIHEPSVNLFGNTYDLQMVTAYYDPYGLSSGPGFISNGIKTVNNFVNYGTFGMRR